MLKNILIIGAGSFVGGIARYLTYLFVDKKIGGSFPVSTFTVNIIGSLILGIIAGLLIKNHLSDTSRLALAVGFCGSYTTFSTFALENMQLLNEKPATAIMYITASVVIGLAAVMLGFYLGKSI